MWSTAHDSKVLFLKQGSHSGHCTLESHWCHNGSLTAPLFAWLCQLCPFKQMSLFNLDQTQQTSFFPTCFSPSLSITCCHLLFHSLGCSLGCSLGDSFVASTLGRQSTCPLFCFANTRMALFSVGHSAADTLLTLLFTFQNVS